VPEGFDGFVFPADCEDERLDRGRDFYERTFKAFRSLVNYCFPKSKGCGALAVLEPQKSLSPHIHAIVYGPYVPQEILSCAWRALTGDSYVVDIRQIRSVSDAQEYVFKYISKPPSNLERANDVAVYVAVTRGFRRLHSFGIWYNIGRIEPHSVGCPVCGLSISFDVDYYSTHDGPFPIGMFQMRGIPICGSGPPVDAAA
jgi:predicted nucleic acid-binding Zn ribbon protein